ncbi:hypothetical protein CR105_17990 [Massilia eurypsychrophila]|uniref:Uncharacterized protein n=1 Tax=Massilia eurypsychrophila TaxID=1485217 RepID=A0A2G8TC94_9BURK|nr:hypothetical protein [Massilia eurypsychrophila]PIL43652.1 hypothetical protein CR105_17990 [Massilia eurypsychrophila]
MLDFSLESTTDYHATAESTVRRGPTARSPADRRTATPKAPATPTSLKRQRRRHDNLNMSKQPLEW